MRCINCDTHFSTVLSHPNLGPICPICLVPIGRTRAIGKRNPARPSSSSGFGPRKLQRIAVRDGWKCHLCGELVDPQGEGKLAPSLDHVIPFSKGGTSGDLNLRLAHKGCNNSRGNRMLAEEVQSHAGDGEAA